MPRTQPADKNLLQRMLLWLFLVVFAALPFHAVLSTWAIDNFGGKLFFKSWKEILIFVVGVPLVVAIAYRQPRILSVLWRRTINRLIVGFLLLHLLLVVAHDNPWQSEFAGLLINLRMFGFFLIAQVLVELFPQKWLQKIASKILVATGAVVVVFGFLQVLVLPPDVLARIGYGPHTIMPFYTIDNNPDLVRIISTLRGPNQLGAFIILWLPLFLLTAWVWWRRNVWGKVAAIALLVCAMVSLLGSGSRSALLGCAAAVLVFGFVLANKQWRLRLAVAAASLFVLGLGLVAIYRDSSFVQVTLLHTDPAEASNVNSDNQRLQYLADGVNTIADSPAGKGVGTTNVASTYGPQPITAESSFMQIAIETGVLGLALFVAILVAIGLHLWHVAQTSRFAAALFASLIGITLTSLLLPAWSDETLSMLWWACAALTIPALASNKNATKSRSL